MATLLENVTRIKNGVADCITSVINKGVTVPTGTKVDELSPYIDAISTGTDVSDTTATADKVLDNYYFYTASGVRTEGTMNDNADWGTPNGLEPNQYRIVPKGYHSGTGQVYAKPNTGTVTIEDKTMTDLGIDNLVRYVDTSLVPNVNTDTYHFAEAQEYFADAGLSNSVRYIDAEEVYNSALGSHSGREIIRVPKTTVIYLSDYSIPKSARLLLVRCYANEPESVSATHYFFIADLDVNRWWSGSTNNDTAANRTIPSIASTSDKFGWDASVGWTVRDTAERTWDITWYNDPSDAYGINTVTPSYEGTQVESGIRYLIEGAGYLYSQNPEGGISNMSLIYSDSTATDIVYSLDEGESYFLYTVGTYGGSGTAADASITVTPDTGGIQTVINPNTNMRTKISIAIVRPSTSGVSATLHANGASTHEKFVYKLS